MNRTTLTVFVASMLAAASVTLVTAPTAAQDKMGSKMAGKMAGQNHAGVLVCEECKIYMSPVAAKKMGGKDAMGHILVQMDKAPEGYKKAPMMDGKMKMKSKMAMDSKMKMKGKMSGPVYVCPECKVYMNAAEAKKLGWKDAMGHPMKKMEKAPAGFTDASKMKMGGKM